jgi:hypothetical protein
MRNWEDLPPNAQTVAVIESCIDCLRKRHPYPPNMIPDRKNFAVARVGYSAAIHILETFMCELTEEIKLEEMADKCNGEFNGQDEQCALRCEIAVECYERCNQK